MVSQKLCGISRLGGHRGSGLEYLVLTFCEGAQSEKMNFPDLTPIVLCYPLQRKAISYSFSYISESMVP
jgi:hypothetical protein